jgi:polar amino acid transport system permease protein
MPVSTTPKDTEMSMADTHEPGAQAALTAQVARLKVVPQRQYGIWIGTALALVLAGLILRALAVNPAFDWPTAFRYVFHPPIIRGLGTTLLLTVLIMAVAIVVGTVVAIMRVSPSPHPAMPSPGSMSGSSAALPALIQLIFWFNLSLLMREVSLTLPFVGTVFAVRRPMI